MQRPPVHGKDSQCKAKTPSARQKTLSVRQRLLRPQCMAKTPSARQRPPSAWERLPVQGKGQSLLKKLPFSVWFKLSWKYPGWPRFAPFHCKFWKFSPENIDLRYDASAQGKGLVSARNCFFLPPCKVPIIFAVNLGSRVSCSRWGRIVRCLIPRCMYFLNLEKIYSKSYTKS